MPEIIDQLSSIVNHFVGFMSSLPEGLEYGIMGAISGLLIQALFMYADWGELDPLFFLVGFFIMVATTLSTFTEVMGKSKGFQIGFIIASIFMMLV